MTGVPAPHWYVTTPDGGPRFFPPGGHPANARQRQQLRYLRAQIVHYRQREVETGVPLPLEKLYEAADYLAERIAEFEQAESEAKMTYYLMLKNGPQHPNCRRDYRPYE